MNDDTIRVVTVDVPAVSKITASATRPRYFALESVNVRAVKIVLKISHPVCLTEWVWNSILRVQGQPIDKH